MSDEASHIEVSTSELFRRLESKVDNLTAAVLRLVVVEERQSVQGARIGALEQNAGAMAAKIDAATTASVAGISGLDLKVERWINRGIGVWGLAIALFALMNSQWVSSFVHTRSVSQMSQNVPGDKH